MASLIRRARLRSLAKINLDLRVLHRNPDGYHELRTVFHTISLTDTIEVEYEPARRTTITIDDPAAIPNNLIVRAAEAALDTLQRNARVHFRLTKKIPMGGGLGGGSSNAATVLLALPVLAGKNVPFENLLALAAALGSDVPFFLFGGAAVGIGRGTEVYPLPDLEPEPLVLIAPGLHVATGAAYEGLERGLTFPDSARSVRAFESVVSTLERSRSAASATAASQNDFEASVFGKYPQLSAIRTKLSKVASGARMTGSGSVIYALFGSREQRDQSEKLIQNQRVFRECNVIRCALVNRSAYRRMWRRQLAEHLPPESVIPLF